jgi:nucleoside-diphosphate-sugar epimerase
VKIAITGANGVVGRALISKLDPKETDITPLDLPDYDISHLDLLTDMTKGHDAILHFAWATKQDNFKSGNIDTINDQMIYNIYKAALSNNIPRVIMASSNHAHNHDLRDSDGKVRASINPPIPDSPYGAEKVFMEALGRFYVHSHGLEVVCIRIGNINQEDKPNSDVPSRWMSHADFKQLVLACLNAKTIPDGFQIVYGVSRQSVFDWSNPFGYEPRDGAI